ncbi:nonsense-mediated mRNA decay protein 2-like [Dioscorea cayenensis subsp. rotundata]|uniref:Nonsense-mediated mRNA decay protein 2-like n=1 Tax=Dioscorea cayennensis subsp. rotundata TaxID=55577 RepID=A0AB40CFM2_DIOCR|nr:nonsense-mediated mRNA decay protein 2-like [Dioscorea cayenensis subsp. rotundata]
MGFIYGVMDKAIEEITTNLGGQVADYKEIWDIIDEKWDYQLHQPLHAAAYFLNPQFQYEFSFPMHPEVKTALYICIDNLITNRVGRDFADIQLDQFKKKRGLFGHPQAQSTNKLRSPADWWEAFGYETMKLSKFAQKDRHLKHKSLNENDCDPLVYEDIPSNNEWIIDDDVDDDGHEMEVEEEEMQGSSRPSKKSRPTNDKRKAPMLIHEDMNWDDIEFNDDSDKDGDDNDDGSE